LEEAARWRDAAAAMFVPYDERLRVHAQSEGFTEHAEWDFAATKPDQYPLLLHFPYFDLYRKQVVKQADLVLAMHMCPDAFTAEEKLRNFDYYEAITVRDSSLSAATQAVVAAEVGHLDLAHDYVGETALIDLRDLDGNTRDGLHLAALAGVWTGLVAGFGGMRVVGGSLRFAPRPPAGIARLRFCVSFRGRCIKVSLDAHTAEYELVDGPPVEFTHHGQTVELGVSPARFPIPAIPRQPRPSQPPGREPARRSPQGSVSSR
jgi:alpha,alpha-trehalose phosphorylase